MKSSSLPSLFLGFSLGILISCVSFLRDFQTFNVCQRCLTLSKSSMLRSTVRDYVNCSSKPEGSKSRGADALGSLNTVEHVKSAKRKLAQDLYKNVRILCWIMTSEENKNKQDAVLETWGTKCHTLLFMLGVNNSKSASSKKAVSKQTVPNIFYVYLPMPENYDKLWLKTKLAFRHIHENYKDTFDWVYKVDDDTFVIMENLRIFLSGKSQAEPLYYGSPYKSFNGYNSGGPGYVMSAKNLDKFIESLGMPGCSTGSGGAEDIEVAKCLRLVGIKIADTRDEKNRFRFSPFEPIHTLHAKKILPSHFKWWWGFTAYPIREGLDCCADTVIAFHYISPDLMRVMEYLIYYAAPFSGRNVWANITSSKLP